MLPPAKLMENQRFLSRGVGLAWTVESSHEPGDLRVWTSVQSATALSACSSLLGRCPGLGLSLEYLCIVEYEAPSNRHLDFWGLRKSYRQLNTPCPTWRCRRPPPRPREAAGTDSAATSTGLVWEMPLQRAPSCQANPEAHLEKRLLLFHTETTRKVMFYFGRRQLPQEIPSALFGT